MSTEHTVDLGFLDSTSNFTVSGTVSPEKSSVYYFDVNAGDTLYTYFDLYDFDDDLDLELYRWDTSDSSWDFLASSEDGDTEPESIFKALSQGSYSLDVVNFSDLDNSGTASDYKLDIDAETWLTTAELPNDPLFDLQWHLFNTGQGTGADNEDIFAPEAWDIRNSSPNVTVAVIDRGIDLSHEDIVNNLWINTGEIPGNLKDDDGNGLIDDYHGFDFANNSPLNTAGNHGTHVAGIIGAEGNNNIGVTGVTWDVNLMSLDVFGDNKGSSYLAQIDAIYYAANNGADVINLSLGSAYEMSTDEFVSRNPEYHQAYKDALTYAVNMGASVVIAAGNDDLDFEEEWVARPAYLSEFVPGVISVAAAANDGQRSSYSNYGPKVTIGAPGGYISSTGNVEDGILSTKVYGDNYGFLQGTSMAAPVVSGAIALLYEENPSLTPAEVETILQDSADQRKDLEGFVLNGAFLDLEEALIMAGQPPYDCGGDEVFRFYHSSNGVHFFTPSSQERDNLIGKPEWGYRYEGIAYEAPGSGGTELFRFFHRDKGYHFMTANSAEADMLIGKPEWGYAYEGRSYQVSPTESDATPNEVYRFYNPGRGIHFYSASESEANNVIAKSLGNGYTLDNAKQEDNLLSNGWGYIYEGIAWYVTDC